MRKLILLIYMIRCDIYLRMQILPRALPRSVLVFAGRYHIILNVSIANNCIILIFKGKISCQNFAPYLKVDLTLGKHCNSRTWSKY